MASGPPISLTCTRPLPSRFTCSTKRTKISPKVVLRGTNSTALSVVSCAAATPRRAPRRRRPRLSACASSSSPPPRGRSTQHDCRVAATIDALLRSDAVHRAARTSIPRSRSKRAASSAVSGSTSRTKARWREPATTFCSAWTGGGRARAARGRRPLAALQPLRAPRRAPGDGAAGQPAAIPLPYHAWTYRLDGSLLGVPLASGYAGRRRAAWRRVLRLESYKGFLFGLHAAAGEGLAEFGVWRARSTTCSTAPRRGRHALRRGAAPRVPRQLEDVHGERGRPRASDVRAQELG